MFKKTGRSKIASSLVIMMIAVVMTLSLVGCQSKKEDAAASSSAASSVSAEASSVSSAVSQSEEADAVDFTFVVVDADGNEETFDISTTETTVGAALLKEGLIEGEDGEYGLYVKKVNGIEADYDKDGVYWAFYVDGEYASSGVDATDVVEGSTYSFKVEKG